MRIRGLWVALVGIVLALAAPATAEAQGGEAPGAPGASANWTTGNKQGLGTSVSTRSKVWYTLSGGALSEVYFPRGDTAQLRSLELAVTDGSTFVDRESEDTVQGIRLVDPRALVYEQVNTARSGRYRITKRYVTDTRRSTVLVRVRFTALQPGDYRLYVLSDPAIGNSSLGDTASRTGPAGDVALLTSEGDTHAALVASAGFLRTSNGFVGTSDGWTDLEADRQLDFDYDTATNGNVLQTGELRVAPGVGRTTTHTLALGFAGSDVAAEQAARASVAAGFADRAAAYRGEWHRYLDSLRPVPYALSGRLRTQYTVAVMTVKAHEDKTYRGAFIASLTLPWGFAVNADSGGGGYHFVWARDLYHQVTGLLAAGDRAAADRAVTWLFERQQQADGTFPQNSRVDGEPDQRNIQLDETAFPLVLAYQLRRTDLWPGVRRAAEALVRLGPSTPQERWEETGGYSPSTTAAEIAGLVAAAKIAAWRGDRPRERLWLGVADEWQRNTEEWMFTTTGPYGDGRYYLRINADTDPNDDDARDWGNAAGVHLEKEVVDAGFLELVRLGVKAPGDRFVRASLAETDASLATDTPSGRVWHRYTFDGYGEKDTGEPWTFNTPGTEGRAWPLLSGERGEYVVANGGNGLPYLRTMARTANDGYMIPEQVWDESAPAPAPYGYQPGKATGSASPLAWAMAQYIRLSHAIRAGRPVETPAAVRDRYVTGRPPSPHLELTAPADRSVAPSSQVVVRGSTDAARVYIGVGDDVLEVVPRDGTFEATVDLGRGGNVITVVAWRAGGTAMRQVTVASYGTRIGGFTDPAGDDDGPGTYVYPTCSCFNPGAFDLTALDVYADGDDVLFVARIAGEVLNPFGGDQISLQRLNVYLGAAPDGTQPALPGTNMDTAEPWQVAVVGDGRFDQAGLYAPDGSKVAAGEMLAVPQTRQFAVAVPRSALGGLDPATALYGTAMLGNAEEGEGVGFVRPVYSLDYWSNPPAGMEWVTQFRFGGGAGEVDFALPSKDTDTRDPNALDVVVGPGQSQAQVLDWTAGSPVQLPMLPLP